MPGTEDSFFVEALGRNPLVKTVDFLLENKIFDFTKADIAQGANVSRVTLDKIWPALEENEIVCQKNRPAKRLDVDSLTRDSASQKDGRNLAFETRRIGNAVLYTLNSHSSIVKKLVELDIAITEKATERMLANERVPMPA